MRTRNGWTDDGTPLRNGAKKCPNCGSTTAFKETISMEKCTACGLECDYWGGGSNKVYEDMMARDAAIERNRREEEHRKWEREMQEEHARWLHPELYEDED